MDNEYGISEEIVEKDGRYHDRQEGTIRIVYRKQSGETFIEASQTQVCTKRRINHYVVMNLTRDDLWALRNAITEILE